MMNKDSLHNKVNKIAKGNNAQSLHLYQMFFFEHILERISISKYKSCFILKGGLLLSSMIGNQERTTKDMDVTIRNFNLDEETVSSIFNEIMSIDIGDNIKYEIISIKDIRDEDEYGGYRLNILATFETIKLYMAVELTTGDKITPNAIEYNYSCVFDDKKIPIFSYNVETIIAEKFQTIISRGIYNSRLKDFYDLYMLINFDRNIDNVTLKQAITNTFNYRNTFYSCDEMKLIINDIRINDNLSKLWINYQSNSPYASNIKYDNLFEPLYRIINIISE